MIGWGKIEAIITKKSAAQRKCRAAEKWIAYD